MLSFTTPTVYEASKCFFTYGTMSYPDAKQPPSKGKPWNALLNQNFVHKVDLIITQDSWSAIRERLVEGGKAPVFYKVAMTVGQLLEGDFFTEYIKIGDILMLSEGRTNADNVFTLKDGKLTMYLEKETYERAGLVGKPHGVKGNRGVRPRWVVEYDLRSPSMFKGKKGFDRLVYACKNVLHSSVNWLFCNLSTKTPDPDPLQAFGATRHVIEPHVEAELPTVVPVLKPFTNILLDESRIDFEEFATEIYEWLSLMRLQSPRILSGDNVDPFISRYQVPGDLDQHQKQNLCKISWQGLVSPTWSRNMLVDIILALPSQSWFSLSTSEFSRGFIGESAERTVLRPPNSAGEYLLWEIKAHE